MPTACVECVGEQVTAGINSQARCESIMPFFVREAPPSKTELQRIQKLAGVPLKKLFNTSGESYREGRFGERLATMTDAQAFDALSRDGKLIKRPLLVASEFALVGFDEQAYEQRF